MSSSVQNICVIGDGQNSQVRRQANLQEVAREKRRYGFRRHFRITSSSCYMELHWGVRSQIYNTPVAPDEFCVAVISRDSKRAMASLMLMLECNSELQGRVLAALARNPAVFRSFLAVHVGAAQFGHLCSWKLF